MIEIIFQFGGEIILVKIEGNNVYFGNTTYGARMATIDGIKLSHAGVIKEFPDLEDDENWREEAIKRFKEKIKSCKKEQEIADYVITDLKEHGYIPKRLQINGKRPVRLQG